MVGYAELIIGPRFARTRWLTHPTTFVPTPPHSRGANLARVMHRQWPSKNGGRREHRMLAAPAGLACKRNAFCARKHRQGSRHNRRSLRNGFTAYTWSPRSTGLVSLRRLALVTPGLIPASGNRDRTISPSATCASSLRTSRPSHPAPRQVTIGRNAPLAGRDGRNIHLILSSEKANYFREGA